MKKLRLSSDERTEILGHIEQYLSNLNRFEDIDLKDFKKLQEPDKNIEKPLLLINADTYLKMYALVQNTNLEIEWHMLCKRDKENQIYRVYDVLVFPQENTAHSTNTNQEEYAEWMLNLLSDMEFPIEDLRGHGHSHVNMSVYSSAIDDEYQRNLITKVEDDDYYIFLILNKKFEMHSLIYDFTNNILFENKDIEVRIIDMNEENITGWAKSIIKENVKMPPAPIIKTPKKKKGPKYSYEEYYGGRYYGLE